MSFRIEEKILIGNNQVIEFKKIYQKKHLKRLYKPRVIRSLYFENINSCLYFSGRLNDQPNIPRRDSEKDRITAYCLPTTVDTSKIKVHR